MCLERYELQQALNKVATKISWSNFKIHHENTGNNFEKQKETCGRIFEILSSKWTQIKLNGYKTSV